MGMNYEYAGSANYPRFDREICSVVEIFGGTKTEHLKEREMTENERPFGYWFGFMSSDDSDAPKLRFSGGRYEVYFCNYCFSDPLYHCFYICQRYS